MLTILFFILLISIFLKVFGIAIKAAWGVTKIVGTVIMIPLFLVLLVVFGFISVAFPVLLVIGAIVLIKSIVVAL